MIQGDLNLNLNDQYSIIPPPIPESLPTTPGPKIQFDEINDNYQTISLPQQIRPNLIKNDTSTTLNRLLGEDEIDENIMSLFNPQKNFYRVISSCTWTFMLGMSDGCLGSLLPYIEDYYNISYAIVSLIWLGNALGFILIAFTAHIFDSKLGKYKSFILSSIFFIICYSIVSTGTKFPIIIIGYFFAGLGGAIGLSQFNIFLAKLLNGSKYLGLFHGCYGMGATIAPLVATSMVNHGIKWHFFFFLPLAASISNLLLIIPSFKGIDDDLKKFDIVDQDQDQDLISNEIKEESHDFKSAFKDYRTWLTCIFIFFYQGAEVSMGGWVVTFLLEYRDGNLNSTGYVSSGFWGGVTLGRFLLTHFLSTKFGVRKSILLISLIIFSLDILAWLIPNVIASAIFACFIGLFIGPIYPMMIVLVTKILPRKIRFCALTLGTAFGSSGGSAIPFTIGIASEFIGTYVLHPIFLGCYFCMIMAWLCFPNIERIGGIKNFWQRIW
ncbi:hypothetical protein WICMUC_001363 [Wickerhamomyces mucosus]|uniref:Major facilitator superfamily (MFS) profile domain-containing protein n=1 Tax=Wickerhamomyces mucosus TaxID=1378264 RepID=A0A9P8PWI2_9ASCO|nr:hypothetical protein WICMUC_001363 [Wickerhamomyces mucosus]